MTRGLKSIGSVCAGVLVIVVVATLVDFVLHSTGVFPLPGQSIDDALALLASSYRIVIGIGGGWITARLAPDKPMKHAMILGCLGAFLALVGVVVTWNMGLGPRWYPISLVVLALPESWAGGKIYEMQSGKH